MSYFFKTIAFFLIPLLTFSQDVFQIQLNNNGSTASALALTNDNGFLIPTSSTEYPSPDDNPIQLFKVNNTGMIEWVSIISELYDSVDGSGDPCYASDYELRVYDIKRTSDNGYIIVGQMEDKCVSPDETLLYLLKVDVFGDKEWSHTFSGDEFWNTATMSNSAINNYCEYNDNDVYYGGFSIEETNSGEYIIAGFGGCDNDEYPWIMKTDLLGNHLWSKVFDLKRHGVTDIVERSDGGYVFSSAIVGSSSNISKKSYVFSVNSSGEQPDNIGPSEYWFKEFIDFDIESIVKSGENSYVFCGTYYDPNSEFDANMHIFKLDGYGNEEWAWSYGGEYDDFGKSVDQTMDGGYIVSGSTASYGTILPPGNSSMSYLIKTDSGGSLIWQKTFGQNPYLFPEHEGRYVQQTSDGGYVLLNRAEYGGIYGAEIIKTDSEGELNSTSIVEFSNMNKKLITTSDILGRDSEKRKFAVEIYNDGTIKKHYLLK